jgi:hypothetical protein
MANLFRKLNTLVRAQIEGLLDEAPRLPGQRKRGGPGPVDPHDPAIKRDVQLLHEQIDDALDREEALLAQLDSLRQQAADLDLVADNAVLDRNDDEARQALTTRRYNDQQIAMLEADLAHHRRMTAALMDQVNVLESQEPAAPAPSPDLAAADQPEAARVIKVPIVVDLEDAPPEADAGPRPPTVGELPSESPARAPDNLDARRARLARQEPEQEE